MIEAGTYKATILSHAISETKGGNPQAAVTFSLTDKNQKPHTMTWFGSFKEGKALDITLKALITCGLKGNNPSGHLEIGKEVSIVIEHEDDMDGKTHAKVKWINQLGEIRNVIPQDLAKNKLAHLEGAVMLARSKGNGKASDSDEIPF
jgi:hypothetical protein